MPSQEVTMLVGVAVLVLASSANYHHCCTDAVAISPGAFKKGDPNQRCSAGKGAECMPKPNNPWERGCQEHEHCRGAPPGKAVNQPDAESSHLPDHGPRFQDEGGDDNNDDDDDDIDEDVDDRKDVKEIA